MAESYISTTTKKIRTVYDSTIDIVFAVILLFVTLTMIIGVFRLFYQISTLLQQEGITGNYLNIFTDVLTLFILIELSRSLLEHFISRRILLTPIIDAGIVFVLRHIMIDLFNHKLDTNTIYALSVLLLALGAIRIGVSINYQREKKRSHRIDEGGPDISS